MKNLWPHRQKLLKSVDFEMKEEDKNVRKYFKDGGELSGM